MIRAGTNPALVLAAACAEPLSIRELLDVVAVRTGEAPTTHAGHYAAKRLCDLGLLHPARAGLRGCLPALYALTPLGERELDRLFMEARL